MPAKSQELAYQELRALVTATHERGTDLETNGPTHGHVSLGKDIAGLASVVDTFLAGLSVDDSVLLIRRADLEEERRLVAEFIDLARSGAVTQHDGTGHYSDGKQMFHDVDVAGHGTNLDLSFSHVAWNK